MTRSQKTLTDVYGLLYVGMTRNIIETLRSAENFQLKGKFPCLNYKNL